MNRRRRRLLLAGGACLPWRAARGQAAVRNARVGFLSGDTRASIVESGRYEAFFGRLRELGWVVGRNLVIEGRFGEGRAERLPALAAELAVLKVDLVMAQGGNSARAMQKASATIPVVFHASDPVGSGLVVSLGRPGGNLTGVSLAILDVGQKYVEFLKVALPKLTQIGMFVGAENPALPALARDVEQSAQRVGLRLRQVQVRQPDDIAVAFTTLASDRVEAVIIPADTFYFAQRRQIAALALKHRVATIFPYSPPVEAGGLMSYGAPYLADYRRAAEYADKILKGAKPANLPVEQPMRWEFVINRKTAQALGIALSGELLLRADRVIE